MLASNRGVLAAHEPRNQGQQNHGGEDKHHPEDFLRHRFCPVPGSALLRGCDLESCCPHEPRRQESEVIAWCRHVAISVKKAQVAFVFPEETHPVSGEKQSWAPERERGVIAFLDYNQKIGGLQRRELEDQGRSRGLRVTMPPDRTATRSGPGFPPRIPVPAPPEYRSPWQTG